MFIRYGACLFISLNVNFTEKFYEVYELKLIFNCAFGITCNKFLFKCAQGNAIVPILHYKLIIGCVCRLLIIYIVTHLFHRYLVAKSQTVTV